jgi:hypothetical protein
MEVMPDNIKSIRDLGYGKLNKELKVFLYQPKKLTSTCEYTFSLRITDCDSSIHIHTSPYTDA